MVRQTWGIVGGRKRLDKGEMLDSPCVTGSWKPPAQHPTRTNDFCSLCRNMCLIKSSHLPKAAGSLFGKFSSLGRLTRHSGGCTLTNGAWRKVWHGSGNRASMYQARLHTHPFTSCYPALWGGGSAHRVHPPPPAAMDENQSTKTWSAWGGEVADLSKEKGQEPFPQWAFIGLA